MDSPEGSGHSQRCQKGDLYNREAIDADRSAPTAEDDTELVPVPMVLDSLWHHAVLLNSKDKPLTFPCGTCTKWRAKMGSADYTAWLRCNDCKVIFHKLDRSLGPTKAIPKMMGKELVDAQKRGKTATPGTPFQRSIFGWRRCGNYGL